MKINELKQIIREEIEKVLAEAPQTAPVKPDTDVETKPRRRSPEDDEFGTSPNREKNPDERPKDKAEDAAKKIAKKIENRYNKMLKNKK